MYMKIINPRFVLGLWGKRSTKIISVFALMLLVVGCWQMTRPATVDAALWTDLPTAVTAAPLLYTNLIAAHGELGTAIASMNTTQTALNSAMGDFNTLQSNLLFKAMDQGAGAVITFDRITDPSRIVQSDAKTLVTTSLADLAVAGILVPQVLSSSSLLSSSTVDLLIESAMKDLGIDPYELKRATGFKTVWFEVVCESGCGGWWVKEAIPFARAIDDYWAMVDAARLSIKVIPGQVTLANAKAAIASALLGQLGAANMPSICPGSMVNSGSGPCPMGLVALPGSGGEMELLLGANFNPMYIAGTNEGLRDKVVADILAQTGLFTIVEYKNILASSVSSVTGYAGVAAIRAAVAAPSVAAFKTTIKDSIQNAILGQFGVGQSYISPTSINSDMQRVLADPTNLVATDVHTYAQNLVNNAIAAGGVDISQLKGLYTMPPADVQNIITAALADTGLGLTFTPAQISTFKNNVLTKFSVTQDTMNVAAVRSLVAGQLNIAGGGGLTVATLITQLSAGTMGAKFDAGIKDVMVNNVLSQMGSANALLAAADIKSILSSSMISATGLGDITKINTAITGMGVAQFTTFTGNLQGLYNGQLTSLTGKMDTMLASANIEKIVATQMTKLTGLGSVAGVQGLINDSLGQSLGQVALIGGQLGAATQAFNTAFGSMTTSLNSLSATFNDKLVGMTSLVQSNIAAMTGQLTGMVANLQTQVTGPITAAVASAVGPVTNTIAGGAASAADLGSLAATDGGLTSVTSSVSSSSGGASSASSGTSASSGMTLLPIGGFITYALYCTCSAGNILLTVAGPYPGLYMYIPGATTLYPNFQIYRTGPAVLGLAATAMYTCMQVGFPSCWPSGAGTVISQIGTSI